MLFRSVPYGKPLTRTREYVSIVRQILRREAPLEHKGEHYQIPYAGPGATGLGKPLKSILHGRPELEIYTASIGPAGVACSAEVADGLIEAFAALRMRDGLRAVVLTGAGDKAFLGGADLDVLNTLDRKSARAYITSVHDICAGIRGCPVPVIGRINGYCIGAGMEIAAACDMRVVAAHAEFSMPEVQVGLPSVVEAAILPTLLGPGRARWLVFTGQSIDAQTADRWGFVEVLSDEGELDRDVDALVDTLVRAAPGAMITQKQLVLAWERLALSDAVEAGIDAFEASFTDRKSTRLNSSHSSVSRMPSSA